MKPIGRLTLRLKANGRHNLEKELGAILKKRILTTFAVLGLLTGAAVAVYAESVTLGITGGALSATAANVTLSAVTLTGADQVPTSAAASNNWTATDARGSGGGWNLTIDSTDFTDGGAPLRTIDISTVGKQFKIQLLDANVTTTSGNAKPTSSATVLTAIPEAPAAPLKFVSAALDSGMGIYNLSPNFELGVPAETYVGTATYTATITVTAVSGP